MPPAKGGVTTFMLNLLASPLARQIHFIPFNTARPPKPGVTDNWGYAAMLRGGPVRIVTGIAVTIWHLAIFPLVILRHRVDAVQVQASDYQVFWESALYVAIARLLRRPVLLRIGGAFDRFHAAAGRTERRMIAAVLQWPRVVIAQSRFAQQVIRAAGRTGDVVQLPNWCNAIDHTPRAGEAIPTCLFIAGQEAVRKGIGTVIAAAQTLHARGLRVQFHLLAVGPGLRNQIATLGLPGLTMEGPVGHDRVLAMMRRCSLFLLPSVGEGFPNSLVEAMAAGMACIATGVGAVPEMAEMGGVIVIPVNDPAALAAAIAGLAASPDLRAQWGARARHTILSRYTADIAQSPLAECYAALLSQPSVALLP
jgi:glycosyltransferase involved in cell wall biosynthesis